ncbi:MAG: GGDEF domain-containing protein [Coriobacteriia bacterium]|nr:GGDEF domain-containing protein [Coriobacteriia bacterium]
MPQHPLHLRVTPDERLYARARWAFVVALALLPLVGLTVPGGRREFWPYFGFLCVLAINSAVLSWYSRTDGPSLRTAMMRVLGPDLVVVAGFTYLLYDVEIGFYPAAVVLPAVYALVMSRREAWIAGFGAALAYVVGHAFAHITSLEPGPLVVHALGAAAIPLLTGMVAVSVERRRQREEETVMAVGQREVALEQINRRVSELKAISQITEIVHSSLDFSRVGPLVLEVIAKVLGIGTCCLFVIDKERSETLFSASIGSLAGVSPIDSSGQMRYGALEDHFSCTAAFDHAQMMVLFCASAEELDGLSKEDRLVLSAVASELVVAAENSRLYTLTKKLASTDELTGLANYRHLQMTLDEEISRAQRYSKQFSLLMLDVDDFKGFNDSHGHIAGDVALGDLARAIEDAVREVDLVARYGGEEFSVVLPETDASGAYVVAEKVRESVAQARFADADGNRDHHLTVSIGLATFPVHGEDRESILREADDALYRAKSGGKNRVRTPQPRVRESAGSDSSGDVPEPAALDDEATSGA